jgi:hypothetical protein
LDATSLIFDLSYLKDLLEEPAALSANSLYNQSDVVAMGRINKFLGP